MKPRLLVISPPCHQPVNRAVYGVLAREHSMAVRLVVPSRLNVGGQWRDTPAGAPDAYEMVLLELSGTHGRLQRMAAFDAETLAWNPTHVFVDSDPASLLVRQAAETFPKAKVWAMTAENLPPAYGREFMSAVKALKPARMIAPVMVWLLRAWIHRRVDRVFTLSRDGTRVMESLGLRATQIPLGFDPVLFCIQPEEKRQATRQRLGLRHRTVAYFGRQTPEKGIHLLVDALAGLREMSWHFLIDHFATYGSGYIEELQARITASGIQERVVYFDAKHDEMPDYMNAADIVVLPSMSTPKWKEQYGRVIPEAMACGRAVIGSDSGAIPELISTHGDIFPEGNVEALREALRCLLQAGNLAERGRQASVHAHQSLSIQRQAAILAGCLCS